jgi:hypothetical protein
VSHSDDISDNSATGPLCANWIAQKLNWHWVYWVQMASGGLCWLLCLVFFPETRGDVILSRRAKALTAQTGREHFVIGLDIHETWASAFRVSCSRPLIYLVSAAAYRADGSLPSQSSRHSRFGWDSPGGWSCTCWYDFANASLFVGAIVHVFEETYGFSQGQGGTVLITGFLGAVFGWLTNFFVQEHFYQRSLTRGHGKAVPEVRLYSSAVGGLLFAIGCFCL